MTPEQQRIAIAETWNEIKQWISWWCWRRWNIYCPKGRYQNESRKSVVARLNKKSWPCSDKPLWYPSMAVKN